MWQVRCTGPTGSLRWPPLLWGPGGPLQIPKKVTYGSKVHTHTHHKPQDIAKSFPQTRHSMGLARSSHRTHSSYRTCLNSRQVSLEVPRVWEVQGSWDRSRFRGREIWSLKIQRSRSKGVEVLELEMLRACTVEMDLEDAEVNERTGNSSELAAHADGARRSDTRP